MVKNTYFRCCVLQLSDIGLDLGFVLNRLFSEDVVKLIQQAGDNQVEAIRHRAAVF